MPPIIPNFWKEEILPADTNGDFLGLRQHLAGAEEESWDNGQCEVMSLDHEGEGRQGGEAGRGEFQYKKAISLKSYMNMPVNKSCVVFSAPKCLCAQ